MELKLEENKADKNNNQLVQQILADIFASLKTKFVQPVLEKNLQLTNRLEEFKEQELAGVAELKERLEALENSVQQLPITILAALRDAINQAGGGEQNVD